MSICRLSEVANEQCPSSSILTSWMLQELPSRHSKHWALPFSYWTFWQLSKHHRADLYWCRWWNVAIIFCYTPLYGVRVSITGERHPIDREDLNEDISRRLGLSVATKRSVVAKECFRGLIYGNIEKDGNYHAQQIEKSIQKTNRWRARSLSEAKNLPVAAFLDMSAINYCSWIHVY